MYQEGTREKLQMVANRWGGGGGLSQTVAWAFWPLRSHISNLPNWHFCEENKLLVERTGRGAVSLLRSPSVISDTYWSQSSVEPGDSDDWSLFTVTSSGRTHQLHHLLVSQSSIPGSSHQCLLINNIFTSVVFWMKTEERCWHSRCIATLCFLFWHW